MPIIKLSASSVLFPIVFLVQVQMFALAVLQDMSLVQTIHVLLTVLPLNIAISVQPLMYVDNA